MQILSDIAIQAWFSSAVYELNDYFRHLTKTQWGIVSAGSLLFGILCLRSVTVRD